MHLMAEMSREDVIERLRWIDREAQDEWVLIPAEREAALRHAIAAVATLSRYKALHMDTLVALREKVSAMREQPGTPTIGQIERLIESFIAEARALKEAPDGK
jgi:hypothetical protein